MRLDSAAIEEFKKIYQEEFREALSQAEAEEMASRVVRLYELLARPLPSERADYDFNLKTFPLPEVESNLARHRQGSLITLSREKYAKRREEVEAEVAKGRPERTQRKAEPQAC